MRLAACLLVAFICSGATAQDGPVDCSKWTLYGYRIGMPQSEAVALHGGKLKSKGTQLRPEIESDSKVRVRFTPSGIVDYVRGDPGGGQAEIKMTLIRRLGPPTADGLLGESVSVPGIGHSQVVSTRWESTACDTAIQINTMMSVTASDFAFNDNRVRMWRLSSTNDNW